jgi:hypothetical protein
MENIPAGEPNPQRLTKLLVHYILWFPVAIAVIVVFQMKPDIFEWSHQHYLVFGGLYFLGVLTFPLANFIRQRPKQAPGQVRMLALLQAALGEACAILGIMFYLFTGDQNLAPLFGILWGIHYYQTIRSV